MSADMFILELFIKDERAQCAVLSSNIFSGSSFSRLAPLWKAFLQKAEENRRLIPQ